jgi:peptidylprolyl isomerase
MQVEKNMKSNRKGLSLILSAIMLAVLVLSLAACKSSSATSEEGTTVPGDTTGSATLEATAITPTATVEPIVLEGAITTETGLQYLEITAGTGETPQAGDIITMDYTASLPDGTVLVDTYSSGSSVTTVWGQERLLPGWEEGVGMMKAGGSAKLVLPPDLAFGEDGYGDYIPANSQIIIEVELLSIKTAPVPSTVADEDLTTSDTGLQYYDLSEGSGDATVTSATVTTNYTIWIKTEDGFDYIDSSDDSSAIEFVVGRGDIVFPGWEEGVTGMKVGGKRYLVIPPDLAFGDTDNGVIPANSTLVMEVELTEMTAPQVMTDVNEEDYTVTESGLKYYDMVEGTGEEAVVGQTVSVQYTGWLEDGTQFDTSLDSGSPFSFTLGENSVIAGWEEGLLGMKVGGKRQLVIPADLAYGESGSGIIPANATLIFEVELVSIDAGAEN